MKNFEFFFEIMAYRPQTIPESGYYPLKFDIGASISILQTNVTFQNIQFIVLDHSMKSVITVSARSSLFLNV